MAAGAGDGAPGPGGPAAPAGGGAVITERRAAEAPKAVKRALKVLASGGVVAFPTDTVYGLGAPAFKVESIERLYAIKGRQQTKAIAVLIAEPGDLGKVAKEPNEQAMRLAQHFWPGALTLVLACHPDLPGVLSPNDTIGMAVADHLAASRLLSGVR